MCGHCQGVSCNNVTPAHLGGDGEDDLDDIIDCSEDMQQSEDIDHYNDDDNDDEDLDLIATPSSVLAVPHEPRETTSKKRQHSDDE